MERITIAVWLRALAGVLLGASVAAAQPVQTIAYGDATDHPTTLAREVGESPFGAEAVLSALPEAVRGVALAPHPSQDRLAMTTEDADGALRVRFRDGGAWGVDALVAPDVTGPSSRAFDGAYEQNSGELLLAYRKAGQTRVYVRAHDGSLSSETSVDLGLGAPPERIALVPAPGGDAILLVASDGARLCGAVWDGEAFGAVTTIEASFTNGADAWDAARESAGGWIVAWARAGQSGVRSRRCTEAAWLLTELGPDAGGAVDGVRLAPSDALTVLAARTASTIVGAMRSGSGWSAPETLATGLPGQTPFDLAPEGAGPGVIGAWTPPTDDRVSMRRWDGTGWSAVFQSAALADGLSGVTLAARDDSPGVVAMATASLRIVVYTEAGSADVAGATVFGLVGEDLPGVDLPPSPGASHGGSDLSFGNNKDETIAPGAYRDLSVGNNTTLRLSAGTYVFRSFDSDKNGTRLVCDTTAGDVEIILTTGDLKAKNGLTIERTGSNAVVVHLQGGNFIARNDGAIEAAVFVHGGTIDIGLGATIVGHLFASGGVSVDGGTIAPPAWDAPGVPEETGQDGWALVVDEGSPGAPVALTGEPWMATWTLPLASSERCGSRALRILRWTETPAFED